MRRLADRPAEELLSDDVVLGSAQFRFLLAIEVCVDIGRHIIAAEGLSAADTYADVFTSLADAATQLTYDDLAVWQSEIRADRFSDTRGGGPVFVGVGL